MNKIVTVSRTSYDATDVNTAHVPDFCILKLCITAGGKSSRSSWQELYPPPNAYTGGSDDFHFVPEFEHASIEYEIDDPVASAGGATLEFSWRKKLLWTLSLEDLGEDTWTHGKHAIKWDGRVVSRPYKRLGRSAGGIRQHDLTGFDPDEKLHRDFPDGYMTLEHSPYKVKLTLINKKDQDQPAVAFTYFHILVKSMKLELGPKNAVPDTNDVRYAMDMAVFDSLEKAGGIPMAGTPTRRVYLASDLYKFVARRDQDSKRADRQMGDNTGYEAYEKLWDDGPRIPIVAKIRLEASNGQTVELEHGSVKGAKALGNTRFLWDWQDVPENVAAHESAPAPVPFIVNAIDYPQSVTHPKGDNCHVDRGGKRGLNAQPVFPPQTGYDPQGDLKEKQFPFKVEACKTRTWAALSYPWTTGQLKGRTGVLFQPSRMAGDSYKLVVYVGRTESDKISLDSIDEALQAPTALKAETGPMEIWRKIHILRYAPKNYLVEARRLHPNISDLIGTNRQSIRRFFSEAFVDLDEGKMVRSSITHEDYNDKARTALKTAGFGMMDALVDPDANHYGATQAEFLIRSWQEFQIELGLRLGGTPAQMAERVATWLKNNGANTLPGYKQLARDTLQGPGEKLARALNLEDEAKSGIVIVQFDCLHSLDEAYKRQFGTVIGLGGTATTASAINNPNSHQCYIAVWYVNPGTNRQAAEDVAHEIGHQMFLPHAPFPVGVGAPGGAQPERHDGADSGCLMSYSNPRPAFCGLCQLRLRGWDAGPNDPATAKLKCD